MALADLLGAAYSTSTCGPTQLAPQLDSLGGAVEWVAYVYFAAVLLFVSHQILLLCLTMTTRSSTECRAKPPIVAVPYKRRFDPLDPQCTP